MKHEKRFWLLLGVGFVAILLWQLSDSAILPAIRAGFSALTPFLFAFVTAYLLHRPVLWAIALLTRTNRVHREKPWMKNVAVPVILVLFLGLLCLLVIAVVPGVVNNLIDLGKRAPEYISRAVEFLEGKLNSLTDSIGQDSAEFLRSAFSSAAAALSDYAGKLPVLFTGVVVESVSFLASFVIYVIAAFYLMLDYERNKRAFKRVLHILLPTENAYCETVDFLRGSDRIVEKYITIKLLTSLALGVVAYLVFTLIGLPYSALMGAVVAATNLVPYIGPFVGAVPPILAGLLVNPLSAVWAALSILVLQQLEGNIITPKIMGDALHVSPFSVILWVTVLGAMFGIPGMILGAPAAAILSGIFKKILEARQRRKQEEQDHAAQQTK